MNTTTDEITRAIDKIAAIRAQIADLKACEETRRLFLTAALS